MHNYLDDSIINNQTYRKIGVTGTFGFSGLLFREDVINRKDYRYIPSDGIEILHYDFSLSVGYIYIEPNHVQFFEVQKIDVVPSEFGPIKQWRFENSFGQSFSYREAVGTSNLSIP